MKYSLLMLALVVCVFGASAQRKMEKLDRGVVAVPSDSNRVFISWRWLESDSDDVAFNVYKKEKDEIVLLNTNPIEDVTCFIDTVPIQENSVITYSVIPENQKIEINSGNSYTLCQNKPYISIPLKKPDDAIADGVKYSYSANDASVGDLDGDGRYEIILKWSPSTTRNPPQSGITGITLLDAYKMDGTFLWRINLGKNVRSGAAYNPFLVYDFDGDGRSEIICRTADGTIDGCGSVIGDSTKDWRNLDKTSKIYGKILEGLEYLTVFEGVSGKEIDSKEFIPTRYPLNGWGGIGGNGNNDSTGGRSDRFYAAAAYLGGKSPSAVFVRGIYGRTVMTAWDFKDGKLKRRWVFDSKDGSNPYSGMGNHQLSVADMDNDGKDEICVGAMTVNDNGEGLYSTGLRHGDALHITDIDPDNPGLEVFGIHENEGKTKKYGTPGVALYDAATGKILFSIGPGVDVGRGVAADIDPRYRGLENWGGPGGLRDAKGNMLSYQVPSSTNFVVWWDGDLSRELLDRNRIDKWDWQRTTTVNLLTAIGCKSNNWSKATPCLSADIFGDWREEVIWRSVDNSELRIYSTTIPTQYRFRTFMQDPQYRLSIVWQNVGYNQPPHSGFYFGSDMVTP